MRFTKMQGAGNDYIYVDCFRETLLPDPEKLSRLAHEISDRHFGVGGDGLILICPSERADARMRMFNADGSEAEMCGNGVRCVAKYVYDHGIARKNPLRIETGRGVLTIDLDLDSGGKVRRARVDMGEPILEAGRIPVELPGLPQGDRVVNVPITTHLANSLPKQGPLASLGDTALDLAKWLKDTSVEDRMTCVSVGNPHMIVYCGNVIEHAPEQLFGSFFEAAPIFPRRINVHFVQVHSRGEVTMRTWERGSGITLACGTGASAVCVAGVLAGQTDRRLLAHLPGGDLELEWNENDNHVYMTGPAVEVFSGDWTREET
jgi:diaminopimelate epimerase